MRYFTLLLLLLFISISYSQQTETVDFLRCEASLGLFPENKEVSGRLIYTFKVLKNTDSIYLDARNIKVIEAFIDKREAKYKLTPDRIIFKKKFKKGKSYSVNFLYTVKPKKAIYFIDWEYPNHLEANPQIWTQGQGKYTSNWLPSIDDMNDKIEFDLSVSFHKDYEVIANGKLISKKKKNDTTITWQYDMLQPMSSYLVALSIGKYKNKVEQSASGIPLEMYYYPKDEAKFEPTYRYTRHMFDFLEEEIGVPYPWQNYKQVPVKDFLYAGMENTSTTIFSDAYVVDDTAFVDKNYVNVNAHELAHQWFGDLVTETHSTHHWLHEGFATYYALLAEKEVFGEDYYYHKLYEYSQEIQAAQEKDTIPLMNPKASSLTFYKKGAWALHSLREYVGDDAFKISVKKYLEKHQYKNVETDDFLSIVAMESGKNLSEFKKTWLLSKVFPTEQAIKSLNKNTSIAYLHLLEQNNYLDLLNSPSNLPSDTYHYSVFQKILNQAFKNKEDSNYNSMITEAFEDERVPVRQVLASNLEKIPVELKSEYETLLKDKSYLTIETALYNLWANFPEDRKKYLEQTQKSIGFNDKNIRTLWLVMALNTKGFQKEAYPLFYKELEGYTHPAFHFEVRRNAFQYLNELQLISSTTLKNLQQASKHHNWRFRSYCKKLLNKLTEENK